MELENVLFKIECVIMLHDKICTLVSLPYAVLPWAYSLIFIYRGP